MSSNRIKGLNTVLSITENGQLNENFTAIKDHEFTIKTEIKQEAYVGESSDRYDETFHGASGKITMHLENLDFLRFMRAISLRAQNREVNVQFNIQTSYATPSGQRKRVTFPDVYFGEIPVSTPGKNDYVTFTLNWSCGQFRVG
ncbi:MAG: hypothetical protein WC700_18420 [Gemmatimonadaceae bacterium]|jgi:hypothetical protein